MSDAACRTLANKKVTSGFVINTNNINTNDESVYDMINNHHVASIPSPEPLTSNDINTATKNIAKCVIGLVEDFENTKKVMNHWYPWINIDKEKKAMMNVQLPPNVATLSAIFSPKLSSVSISS